MDSKGLDSMLIEAQNYARPMTARILRGRDDVEDTLQDAAMKALAHIEDYRGEAQFRVWFTRIAANEALGRLRRERMRPSVVSLDEEVDGMAAVELPSEAPSPEQLAIGSEITRAIVGAALTMSAALRQEFRLMVLGVRPGTENTRKARRFRVRRILRAALKERGIL